MIGKQFFYNNRPVVVLREEGHGFVFVVADLVINHEITGSNFCFQCNAGSSDYKGGHTCQEADEVIEHVMENIEDHEVFWVAKQYLREQPFEFKPFIQLVEKINQLKITEAETQELVIDVRAAHVDYLMKRDAAKEELADLQEKIRFAQHELMRVQQDEPHDKNLPEIIEIGHAGITLTELVDLFTCRIKLRALEAGGVDNWEWYGASMEEHGGEDASENALIEISRRLANGNESH